MHQDTYALMRKSVEQIRKMLDDDVFDLTWLMGLARAENMLEEHDAMSAALPSLWATINTSDCTGINGEIETIRGGYRVRWLDSSNGDPSSPVPMSRVMDIFAMQSINWLTEAEYAAMTADVHKRCQKRAKEYMRRRTWPEGYRLVKRTDQPEFVVPRYGIQRASDGLVFGFWHSCSEPLSEAWECVDDQSQAEFKLWEYPTEPCSEMPPLSAAPLRR